MTNKSKYSTQFMLIFFSILIAMILFLDSAMAASLEDQLDSANNIVNSKIKTYGVAGASIAVGIWSIFKGNVKQAAIVVVIGVILSYYLSWVEAGMVIGG